MPNIASAKKKQRQDKKRLAMNKTRQKKMRDSMQTFLKKKTKEALQKAISYIDKASKNNVIHKNKANRLKSRISKLLKK